MIEEIKNLKKYINVLEEKIKLLELAEEGAKEAYGVIVDSNQELREKCKKQLLMIQSLNRDWGIALKERDSLLVKLEKYKI